MTEPYFTTKVATLATFCNREQESKTLHHAILKNQHTVVVAPRRYGKTSLVTHTLEKMNHAFARVDFFCVVYEEDICKKIAKAISKLIRQMTSFSDKTIKVIENCFKSAQIGFKAGHIELNIEFEKTSANPTSQLEDLLEGLEKLAKKNNSPVVLFFDEFQDVLKVDATNQIQAAIRAIAQHSRYVTYVFSGSSRLMLNKIFGDKNQPLYMLCHKMILDRIDLAHFKKNLQKAAQMRWKTPLSDEMITTILQLTDSHSYYVNLLCDKLWENAKIPDIKTIQRSWDEALFENRGKMIADLELLNTNRMKVLLTIALLGTVNAPNSKTFLDKVQLPLTSTQHAVHYLMNHDYIYETADGLKITDPLLRKFILENL